MKLVLMLVLLAWYVPVWAMSIAQYDDDICTLIKTSDAPSQADIACRLLVDKNIYNPESLVSLADKKAGHCLYCFAKSGGLIAALASAADEAGCFDKHERFLNEALEHVCFSHGVFDRARAELLVKFGAKKAILEKRLAQSAGAPAGITAASSVPSCAQ